MALRHLLYRCPECGHDPTAGAGDRARCTACGTAYRRTGRGVEVRPPGPRAASTVRSAAELAGDVDARGGPLPAARAADGALRWSAPARFLGPIRETPLRRGGALLGWVDRAGPGRPGRLEVDDAELAFRPERGPRVAWRLEDLTALQVASRSLQVGVGAGRTVEIALDDGDTLRWDQLLRHLIDARWRALGWGAVLEFQPRIVTS